MLAVADRRQVAKLARRGEQRHARIAEPDEQQATHARIARVVYGTVEPKAGAIESAMRAHEHPALNHRMASLAK